MWKATNVSWDELRRPLFGIPANHDYYDQLDGFRRQFYKPVKTDKQPPEEDQFAAPQLMLPGFRRCQRASYIALRLPFDWQLWGLDTELGKIDERQRNFFRKVVKVRNAAVPGDRDRTIEEGGRTGKLIVVTCAPTTVFGKYANEEDEKSAKAFIQLGLSRPFIRPPHLRDLRRHKAQSRESEKTGIEEGQCRLDLSGDIHLYARYWGPQTPGTPRGREPNEHERNRYYASVVSGLGGAFHHPSTTYAGEITEQVLYPAVETSRGVVAERLLSPLSETPRSLLIPSYNIIRGGGVWVVGFAVSFLIYFAVIVASSSRQAVSNFPLLGKLGITNPTGAGLALSLDVWIGVALNIASLVLLVIAAVVCESYYRVYRKHEERRTEARLPSINDKGVSADSASISVGKIGASKSPHERRSETELKPEEWFRSLMNRFQQMTWLIIISASGTALFGFLKTMTVRDQITSFSNSLMIMMSLCWAALAAGIALRYSDWLRKMTSKMTIKDRHWLLALVLSACAVLTVWAGFTVFGSENTAADTMTDISLVAVVGLLLLGLPVLGAIKIGEVTKGAKAKRHYVIGAWIGLFHAVVQVAVPFLLINKGSWYTFAAAIAMVYVMPVIGCHLMKKNYRRAMLMLWVTYGLSMLTLPYTTYYLFHFSNGDFLAEFSNYQGPIAAWADGNPGRMLVTCVAAGLVGLLLSCVWVAWYLSVALLFQGHNNEVGGAARIERFKQFIRFRLRNDDLTGFVIAVDDPQRSGRDLRPRLIDMFRIHVKKTPTT
jgi:hypothetical protein